jgi:hypothetical protein
VAKNGGDGSELPSRCRGYWEEIVIRAQEQHTDCQQRRDQNCFHNLISSIVGSPWTQDEKTAALAGLMVCDKTR